MDETTTVAPMIGVEEVAVLNEARTILKNIERARRFGYRDGRIAEACDSAEFGIFRALNAVNVYSDVDLTDAQLHNGKIDEVAS